MATKSRGRAQQTKRVRAVARKQTPSPPRAVYFLSLTLENVRCFGPKQTLRLTHAQGGPARWTVILGNNGMGKTTLLQVLSACEAVLPSPEYNGADPATYHPRAYARFIQSSWKPFRHLAKSGGVSALVTDETLESPKETAQRHTSAYIDYRFLPGGVYSPNIPEHFQNLTCHGYGATRRMGFGSLSTSKEIQSSDSLFFEDMPLRNAEEWLLQADYAASKETGGDTRAAQRRDRIKQLLIDLLPEVDALRFAPPDAEHPSARVELQTPFGWVSMRGLSLGYRTLIAWMVDLASRLFEKHPDSANPLAEPAVVLVDEIDLHLHPTWQRQLIGYLTERFPNTQFIVTAHSPLVVQSAADANIVVLRREGDHVVIDNDVESIRGWRVDQILTSDLFGLETARPPQIEEFLKERTAILSKSRLTRKDEARLRDLESAIGPLPTGETRTEREALELIQRAAARMKADRK